MTRIPHDALFKSVFQQPENAAAELQHVLPAEHASAIDWSTLKLEPGSFVDDKLAAQHSDLLFSAAAHASGKRVLVYLLFEHQSTPEPKMALRLLSCMVRIWDRCSAVDKNAPLPLILPAVLSQVAGGWRSPTRFSALFSPSLGQLADIVLPDFSYAVDDLSRTDDEGLKRRELSTQARLALWLMRDARDGALLLQGLMAWAEELETLALTQGGERALGPLLRYVADVSPDLQLEEFRVILRKRAPAAESITMTIAEQLRAEGESKGEARGLLRGQAASLLVILRTRGFVVPDEVRTRIEACTDADALQRWTSHAVTSEHLDDVFGAS